MFECSLCHACVVLWAMLCSRIRLRLEEPLFIWLLLPVVDVVKHSRRTVCCCWGCWFFFSLIGEFTALLWLCPDQTFSLCKCVTFFLPISTRSDYFVSDLFSFFFCCVCWLCVCQRFQCNFKTINIKWMVDNRTNKKKIGIRTNRKCIEYCELFVLSAFQLCHPKYISPNYNQQRLHPASRESISAIRFESVFLSIILGIAYMEMECIIELVFILMKCYRNNANMYAYFAWQWIECICSHHSYIENVFRLPDHILCLRVCVSCIAPLLAYNHARKHTHTHRTILLPPILLSSSWYKNIM